MELASFHVYVTGVCERSGAKVVWDDDPKSTPRTDGKTIWVPRPAAGTDSKALMRLRYFIKHEACHVKYTDFPFWAANPIGKTLHQICNILEDHRIDYLNDREFSGDVRLSAAFWEDYGNQVSEIKEPRLNPLTPVFLWEAGLRDWIATAPLVQSAIATRAPDEQRKQAEGLCRFSSRLLSLRDNPKDNIGLLALACDILAFLRLDEGAKAEGGKADGEGEGPAGMPSDLGATTEEAESKRMARSARFVDGKFTPTPVSRLKPKKPKGGYGHFSPADAAATVESLTPSLVGKLRHMLQVRALSHYEFGQKRGKLIQGALASMALTNNDRVFKRKVEGQSLDVAVSILIDCSGSMDGGGKYENACIAAACLSKALSVVGVRHTVNGFTNCFSSGAPILYSFAGWEKPVPPQKMLETMQAVSLQDNADAEFILWAAHDLLQQKATRRILLVMSDGQPSCGPRDCGLSTATQVLIKEASKHVEVLGLGLNYDCSAFYPKNKMVRHSKDIPSGLLSLFSSAF